MIGIFNCRPECLTDVNLPNLSTTAADCCLTIKKVPYKYKTENNTIKILQHTFYGGDQGFASRAVTGLIVTEKIEQFQFVIAPSDQKGATWQLFHFDQ